MTGSVGARGKVVEDKGVDDFGVQDENRRETKWVGLEGEAEGVGLSLVDIGVGAADGGWDAMRTCKAGDCRRVGKCGCSDWDTEGTEGGSGGCTMVFVIVATISGPYEWGAEGVCNVVEKVDGMGRLGSWVGGGGRWVKEVRGGEGGVSVVELQACVGKEEEGLGGGGGRGKSLSGSGGKIWWVWRSRGWDWATRTQ